jgi:hypothetical protein
MPPILSAILYGMLHPLGGAYHIARYYGFSTAATALAMRAAWLADAVLVVLALTVLERRLRKIAAK